MLTIISLFRSQCVNSNRRSSEIAARAWVCQTSVLIHRHKSVSFQCSQHQKKHRTCVTLLSTIPRAAGELAGEVKCQNCTRRHYSTSENGQSGGGVPVSLENVFNDKNKTKFIDRLRHAKPLVRPIKSSESPRKAAVLVPLCTVNGEPSLLFMMRSLHLKNHAGEICFPGGTQDKGDNSLVDTALRETHEEIGLDTLHVEIWGQAAPVPSRDGHLVYPIIGYCGDVNLQKLTLNESEVYSVFTRPLSSFLVSENQRQTQFRYPDSRDYSIPVYTGGEHAIWGLTAIVTHQILTVMFPELYTFKPKIRR